MGKGAFLTVENNGKSFLKVSLASQNCFATVGSWENLIVSNTSSKREYIEASNSGIPCCCETRTVTYGLETLNLDSGELTPVGFFSLNEEHNQWSSDVKTKSDSISITIQPGEEDLITIIYKG